MLPPAHRRACRSVWRPVAMLLHLATLQCHADASDGRRSTQIERGDMQTFKRVNLRTC
jgi:hypothetical protein